MLAGRLARSPLLAAPAGRRLLAAQALDVVAAGVGGVAVPWLVLDGGGDALVAGLAFATTTLPYVLLGLPAGVVGDRVRPGRILGLGHAAQALLALAIPLWALAGTPPIAGLLAIALLIGCLRAFTDGAAFAAVAGIAGPERFTEAQATLTAAWSAGFLIGPAIGGVVIHVLGASDAFLVMAASFALAGAFVARLPGGRPAGQPARSATGALLAGLRLIAHDPEIRVLTVALGAWNLASTGVMALAVPLLREELGLSARQVGLVFGIGAAMGIVSAPLVGYLDRRVDTALLLLVLVGSTAFGAVALGLAHGFAMAAIAYASYELAGWTAVSAFIGARQRRAPHDLQAIVGMSGRVIGQATMTAGAFLASGLTRVVDIRDVYLLMGAATLLVAAASAAPLVRSARRTAAAA